MNRRIKLILLACGILQSIFSQQLELKGRIQDEEKRVAIEYANLVLQTIDSAFVAGTTTDARGFFALQGVRPGDYRLTISSIGYESTSIELPNLIKSRNLGEITLHDAAVSLDNVTVTASNQKSYSDRKIVYPSTRQQKASSNGVDLLQQMMLPRVQVNPLDNSIKTLGNGVVQLRINGVKVEQEDVRALQPSEIVRIEYHDNPGLRYGNADIVLDYIVKRPDTGGTFNAELQQGVNAMWGEDGVSGKVNHKQSEWSAYYNVGIRDFNGVKRDNEESFLLADGSRLNRVEEGAPSHFQQYNHRANLNYSVQNERNLFNAALRYRGNLTPHMDFRGSLLNRANSNDRVAMEDRTANDVHTPALDLYYQRNMQCEQTLLFNLVGTYNRSLSHRVYNESREGVLLTDINNRVSGKKYSLIGEVIYEKKINEYRLSAGIRHEQAYSDNRYANGSVYNTHMVQGESSAYVELKGKLHKLDYTFGLGASRSYYSQRDAGDPYTYYQIQPKLALFYPLPGESSIRLKAGLGNINPSLSELGNVEQSIDSLQVQRGNPNLQAYVNYWSELNYEFRKRWLYFNFNGIYNYQPNPVMEEKFQEGNRIVQTWNNQRNWQRVATSATLRVGPFKDIVMLSLDGGVNHYISNGNNYAHRYTNWYYNASLSLTWKAWSFYYMVQSNWNWFKGETLEGGENIQMARLTYKYKNLTAGVLVFNPFTDNYKLEMENRSRYASYYRNMYFDESVRTVILTLSYNFSFGRKFKAGQKKVHNADNDTGVMNAGK